MCIVYYNLPSCKHEACVREQRERASQYIITGCLKKVQTNTIIIYYYQLPALGSGSLKKKDWLLALCSLEPCFLPAPTYRVHWLRHHISIFFLRTPAPRLRLPNTEINHKFGKRYAFLKTITFIFFLMEISMLFVRFIEQQMNKHLSILNF